MFTTVLSGVSAIGSAVKSLFGGKHKADRERIKAAQSAKETAAMNLQAAKLQADAQAKQAQAAQLAASSKGQAAGGGIMTLLQTYWYIPLGVALLLILTQKKKVGRTYRRKPAVPSKTSKPRSKKSTHGEGRTARVLKLWKARNKSRRAKGLKPVKRPAGY